MQKIVNSAVLSLAVFLAACSPYQQQGAGVGALGGAALGALAGDGTGDVVRGAAIGAAVGTGVTAYQENQRRQADDSYYRDDRYGNGYDSYDQQRAPDRSDRNRYPVAEKTSKPGIVLSPYAPYNQVDVSGFPSGQLARDPENKKIFIVP